MEFKKERVYSAVNADELKPGDKVIVADNLVDLMEFVRKNDVHEIEDILSEECSERFGVCGMANYALAYLIERKENCTNCVLCERTNASDDEEYECSPEGYIGDKERAKTYRCSNWKPKTEKEEPTYKWVNYRPFKDTDELIKVWCKKAKATPPVLDMPYTWVRSKFNKDHKGCLITNFFGKYVMMNDQQCFLSRLFDEYTFLDGSPCGVEE